MTALPLSAEQEDLVGSFLADLQAAGLHPDHALAWGARAFLHRFGGIQGWQDLSLEEQLACNVKIHRFVSWLISTRRLRPTPEYLVARHPKLSVIVAGHDRAFHASFRATAGALGYGEASIQRQWSALCLVCALAGVAPSELTHARVDQARSELLQAAERLGMKLRERRSALYGLEATLFHLGATDELPRRRTPTKASVRASQWAEIPPQIAATMRRYLEQIALSLRPGTVGNAEATLREFALFLAERFPEVREVREIGRSQVEAYKAWLAERPSNRASRLHRHTIRDRLIKLRGFFDRIIEWGWEDAPARPLLFSGDLPIKDEPLPRFLDDGASAKLLRAARADLDPFVRLAVEFLARTGLRKGEFLRLSVDAVVQIGSAFWLRVPVGKLHTDRYVPLHPQLKQLLDEWVAARPEGLRSDLMFVERGRPVPASRVDHAVAKAARAAGIGPVAPHQLRHTLATQAINRGMSLEAIAALLGHRSLRMTTVYARIADRTVADEYFAVSKKVEALYDQPKALPAEAEGSEMAKLRREMHRRMLGNGYCARPVEIDCHFESICESCTFFVTTLEFKPTLQRQRDDAAAKGQLGRQKVFEGLLSRLGEEAS